MANFKNEAQIFNATLESVSVMVGGRGLTFPARQITNIPFYDLHSMIENLPEFIEKEFGEKGLAWYQPGDDIKEVERRALIRYLQVLDFRLNNYTKDREEYRKANGVAYPETIQERKYKAWKDQIVKKLSIEAPLEKIDSFLDAEYPDVAWIGDNFKSDVQLEVNRKAGRPREEVSFDDMPFESN